MELREESLPKPVIGHSSGRNVVADSVRLVVIVEQVQLLEAHLDVGLGILDGAYDRRFKDVLLRYVADTPKVKPVVCLLWSSEHLLKSIPKRLLDLVRKMMLAQSLFVHWSLAVSLGANDLLVGAIRGHQLTLSVNTLGQGVVLLSIADPGLDQ